MPIRQGIECIYCGGQPTKGDGDHVPPKSLMPDDAEDSQQIRVPCCTDCNKKYAFDDEYFFTVIAGHGLMHAVPRGKSINDRARRALQRDKAERLLARIQSEHDPELERHFSLPPKPGDPDFGKVPWEWDLGRGCRVVRRTMQGMCWRVFGVDVHTSHWIWCIRVPDARFMPEEWREPLWNLVALAVRQPGVRFGSVCSPAFRFTLCSIDGGAEYPWTCNFYGLFTFVGRIVRNDIVPSPRVAGMVEIIHEKLGGLLPGEYEHVLAGPLGTAFMRDYNSRVAGAPAKAPPGS